MSIKKRSHYKITRVAGSSPTTDRYFVYRRGLFFWKQIGSEWTQKEAEEVIAKDKKRIEIRKTKPEVVGYY